MVVTLQGIRRLLRPLLSPIDNTCILFTHLVNNRLKKVSGTEISPHLTSLMPLPAGAGLGGGPAFGSFSFAGLHHNPAQSAMSGWKSLGAASSPLCIKQCPEPQHILSPPPTSGSCS